MIKNLYAILLPFKFRLTVFGLLSGATLFCLILFRIRITLSDTTEYAFLIWNLFLAWIPLGMAYAVSFAKKRRHVLLTAPFAAFLWLLFFPNAPYILTDLQHLSRPHSGVPVWFDMLLINWFAWTGILLGVFSLFMMHDIVRRIIGRWAGWVFVIAVSTLSGLGIYLGRFLRWNSWDLLFHPLELVGNLIQYALNPSMQSIVFIGVFSAFFIFIYITLYAFGLLFHKQAHQTS
ncbi:MAG: DUF1361 domain-containing protein [Anaerolineales bacterium]|nr:DUF1361 domain-containing protein [Anaerolineales bacterium]